MDEGNFSPKKAFQGGTNFFVATLWGVIYMQDFFKRELTHQDKTKPQAKYCCILVFMHDILYYIACLGKKKKLENQILQSYFFFLACFCFCYYY